MNMVAICWVAVIAIVVALPPNELVLWTMLLLGLVLDASWRFSARKRFVGPRPS